ncbi:SMP-30/gluconolactonase/LRE family protein [Cellulomonas sp. C5510]|uniref:SMP-30/gluconolactonase/LRE family protein n=1 Tax=Cellulomonas sp. C5510 TaxID=2871170 RepID=UPI001C95BC43|nr:SMP-30/gluconolactonase/LRE family protein [Cellulomonas sp. C5510]QZN85372.1 SMP-30/gluconolactonase/LRE family protein [Cellulomonas sp. C5510]
MNRSDAAPLLPGSAAHVLFDGFRTDPVLDHAEGLDLDPVDGSLWCGGEAGQLYRIDLDAGSIRLVDQNPGGFTLGVRFAPGRRVLWLDAVRRQVRSLDVAAGGPVEVVVDGRVGDRPLVYPNALEVADDGTVYFSDSDGDAVRPGGGVYRIDPQGRPGLWCDGPFHFANGVALSPDGRWLYVAESAACAVSRVQVLPDGSAGAVERVWELGRRVPDGLAVGPDGRLYVACYYPSVVLRLEEGGDVTPVYEDPIGHVLSNPTNLVFRGTEALVANLGRWHVTSIDMTAVLT